MTAYDARAAGGRVWLGRPCFWRYIIGLQQKDNLESHRVDYRTGTMNAGCMGSRRGKGIKDGPMRQAVTTELSSRSSTEMRSVVLQPSAFVSP